MKITTANNHYLLTSDTNTYAVDLNWFDAQFWQAQNAIVATKEGRSTAWFFKQDQKVNVLKHYWRGGLVGKVLSDQYLYTGLENTRVYQEFALLCQLEKLGLPISKPIAAKVSRAGLIYRGDLITEAVSAAQSLCERLQTRSATHLELKNVATTLARFHKAGVYHADLNINNILFDEQGEVYLIDFDRGQLKTPSTAWQQANLSRLQRSFNKEAGKWPTFYFTQEDWQLLQQSYWQALQN
ncbi:3-deoxy-D-manno-octulosonic acid kinase [Pseudoalteromonas byunsanensis]|uniref:3-deoxy-D-manno-octulosonic acid kinase n=2 Tax=Pseudoalteromonas byunsanensis TaxID=327939 RepID=A0A1S1N827_9GAMM|nr:3-deoxy-D-manno-octulosonic acid kinase [Pseudoalteromonas byunsanensis]OHU95576.1 3-deoxy-D-manno-octulosonic acid kinase [Pseudoalteromonas byunsanensis]